MATYHALLTLSNSTQTELTTDWREVDNELD